MKWPLSLKYFNTWPRRTKYSLVEAVTSKDQAQEMRRMIRRAASTAGSLVTSLLNVQSYKRTSQRREASRRTTSETDSRRVPRQHGKNITMNKNVRKMKNNPI